MLYVARNENGEVTAVALSQTPETPEPAEPDAPDVLAFMAQVEGGGLADTLGGLYESDQQLVRVLEDLIDVLIERGILHFTDLPEPAQKKLLSRQTMRKSLNALHLIVDGEQGLI